MSCKGIYGSLCSRCGSTNSCNHWAADNDNRVLRSLGPLYTCQVRDLSDFLSLALKICSQQEALCSCSKRSPSSLGSLCPSVRDGECVVVIRGDCWEAGCHGTTEARAALPGCHHFPGWIHNHRNERRTHGKGERSGSPLTIISCQSRVRGSRLSRGGAHLDMDQAFTERGLMWAGCGFVVLHGSGALPGFQHCFYRKPLFLTH